MSALRKFQQATPGYGAASLEAQTFRIAASQLEKYVRGGQRESVDMAPEVRYMRLFLMLLSGGDDLLDNYCDSGRFRGADVRPKAARNAPREMRTPVSSSGVLNRESCTGPVSRIACASRYAWSGS